MNDFVIQPSAPRTRGKAAIRPYADVPPSLRAASILFMMSLVLLGAMLVYEQVYLLGFVIILCGGMGWRGFKSGGIRSAVGLLSVVCVYFFSVPTGRWLAETLDGWVDWSRVGTRFFSIILVVVGIMLVGQIAGWQLLKTYRRGGDRSFRMGCLIGMLLGMGEGMVLAITISLAFVSVLPVTLISLSMAMNHTPTAGVMHNQLAKVQKQINEDPLGQGLMTVYRKQHAVLEMSSMLAAVSQYPGAMTGLANEPVVEDLVENNRVFNRVEREIRHDYKLKQAVKDGDLSEILNSKTVVRILEDRELAEEVSKHEGELFVAILNAVPPAYREHAATELGKVRGMDSGQFKNYVQRRIDELKGQLNSKQQQTARLIFTDVEASVEGILQDLEPNQQLLDAAGLASDPEDASKQQEEDREEGADKIE